MDWQEFRNYEGIALAELVRQHFMVLWSSGVAWVIDGPGFTTGRKPDQSRFEPLTWAIHESGRMKAGASIAHGDTCFP